MWVSLACVLLLTHTVYSINPNLSNRIQDLFTEVWSSRWTRDTDYFPRNSYPPLQWTTKQGLFPSFVHVNFHGGVAQGTLRNLYHFPDNNGFVTLFVLQTLLESFELGTISLQDSQLVDSILAVIEHRDKNTPLGTPIYSFWNQKQTFDKAWQAYPENIAIPISSAVSGLENVEDVLRFLNLSHLADDFSVIPEFIAKSLNVFSIPADADDTGCNLALGTKLLHLKDAFPLSADLWETANNNLGSVFDYYVKYSYRPFSADSSANIIDSRTYFWIHDFLNELGQNKSPQDLQSLAFISTWFQSLAEIRVKNGEGTRIPFNLNNVDVSVAANSFFGISSHLIMHPETSATIMSDDLRELLDSTCSLLEHVLEKDILHKRGDLALLYYPPVYDFYWFVSRAVHVIESHLFDSHPFHAFLSSISSRLSKAMRKYGMEQIFNSASTEHDSFTGKTYSYWDDFLGNSDGEDIFRRTAYEDRVFSTAVTLNAIIDCWTRTVSDPHSKIVRREWIQNVDDSAKQLVETGINWILDKSDSFPRENAFFSGSVRSGIGSIPFFYPTNVFEYLDGTSQTCVDSLTATDSNNVVAGVRGILTDEEFHNKTQQLCGPIPVPLDDQGKNCDVCTFPYWSAPVLTNALEMLLLSKYSSLAPSK